MKRELQYQARLHNIKQEANEVVRSTFQLEEMVKVLKEDIFFLSQSIDKAQRDKENLMDINMNIEYELHDRMVERK